MLAMAIDGYGPPESVRAVNLPRPVPGRGEVLLRVVAAGVNPVDWKICRGDLRERLPHKFPLIPGWDVAGVVEEQGEGTSGRFREGDRVFACARKPTVQHGCFAEFVAVPEKQLALMPQKLLFEEAAAVPVAGLTAYQALFDGTPPGPESRVLVLAAAGGVGHFAVQLARHVGAAIAGTGGVANIGFLASNGVDLPVNRDDANWAASLERFAPDGYDVIVDGVGGEVLERCHPLVAAGGRLVALVDPPDPSKLTRPGAKTVHPLVEPNADHLERLAGLIDRKKLQPQVEKIFPLAEAVEALQTSMAGHVRGKLVLAL